jgi:hypothetical protein
MAVVALAVSLAATLSAQVAPVVAPPPRVDLSGAVSYTIFLAGGPVGREEVAVSRQADGWTIRGSSRIGPPIATTIRQVEVRYDAAWHPRALSL